MKYLSDKVMDTIEDMDFICSKIYEQGNESYVELSRFTPEGEDWYETIWFDGTDVGFVEALKGRVRNFDVDEEVEICIPSRGNNGVPEKISDLLADAEWKLEILKNLCEELECVVFDKKKTVEITMEKTMRVSMMVEVTNEQLEQLKNGDNPFYNDADFESGNIEYDYAVCDEDGEEIVDWS